MAHCTGWLRSLCVNIITFCHGEGSVCDSVFGTTSTPSPSPLTGTSNEAVLSLSTNLVNKPSLAPFVLARAGRSNTFHQLFLIWPLASPKDASWPSSPTATKHTGFEAFASSSSPLTSNAGQITSFLRENGEGREALAACILYSRNTLPYTCISFLCAFNPARKITRPSRIVVCCGVPARCMCDARCKIHTMRWRDQVAGMDGPKPHRSQRPCARTRQGQGHGLHEASLVSTHSTKQNKARSLTLSQALRPPSSFPFLIRKFFLRSVAKCSTSFFLHLPFFSSTAFIG